jgi:hypothetical protein
MSPARKTAPEQLDPLAAHAALVEELSTVAELREVLRDEARELRQREQPPRADGLSPRLSISHLVPAATQKALDAARVDALRGKDGAAEEVERLTKQRDELEATIRELVEREAALGRAGSAVHSDIEQLVTSHPEEFVAEGIRLAEEAHAAVAEVAADSRLQRAEQAWRRAASYWDALPRTHDHTGSREGLSHITAAPGSPLADVADLSTRCLPPEVAAAIEAGDTPGSVVTFVHVEGARVEVPAGSREAIALDASPQHERA